MHGYLRIFNTFFFNQHTQAIVVKMHLSAKQCLCDEIFGQGKPAQSKPTKYEYSNQPTMVIDFVVV